MKKSIRVSRSNSGEYRKSEELPKVELVPLSSIWVSYENDDLYGPVDPSDPEIIALAESISEHGVLEPLIVTADDTLVSGHRRLVAARLAGLSSVPCRRLAISREDDKDGFVVLLREHNRQRDKTNAEKLHEELLNIDPEGAWHALYKYREAQASVDVEAFEIRDAQHRKKISRAKQPLLDAILKILDERRAYWPLSDRQIHYALLNDPPLKHESKPMSIYRNDLASYKATTELVTRARLEGKIPFEAIADETRPVEIWAVHQDTRSFVRQECHNMFQRYWRDLMQSQPNHIEIVGEKNTVGAMLRPVAAAYTIPLTTGRGYCSLSPRHAMAQRFLASGKKQLVLLIVSDFDPEGEDIAHSFARSMRDDFGIDDIYPIKVALTAEQVREHELPPIAQAKKSSSRYERFSREFGDDVFELEALSPETLQEIVREAIEGVIDQDAYESEIEAEKSDAAFLTSVRRQVLGTLKGMDLGGDSDE